jgi:hypothetical protein
MYAKITEDKLWKPNDPFINRKGTLLIDFKDRGELVKFRCLDDDGEVYYVGVADDEALEAVFDWAARDSGVTVLQCWIDEQWKDVIA